MIGLICPQGAVPWPLGPLVFPTTLLGHVRSRPGGHTAFPALFLPGEGQGSPCSEAHSTLHPRCSSAWPSSSLKTVVTSSSPLQSAPCSSSHRRYSLWGHKSPMFCVSSLLTAMPASVLSSEFITVTVRYQATHTGFRGRLHPAGRSCWVTYLRPGCYPQPPNH